MVKKLLNFVLFSLIFSKLEVGQAQASLSTAQATQEENAVRIFSQKVISLLKTSSSLPQKITDFQTLLQNYFDIQAMGRSVLGPHWNHYPDTAKSRYLSLFLKDIGVCYFNLLKKYYNQEENPVTIERSQILKQEPKTAHVWASITRANGQKVSLKFLFIRGKMMEVFVENVYLMNAKKEEYRSLWRKVTAAHPEQTDQHLTLFLNKLEELIQHRPIADS